VNVRVLSATNRDLELAIQEGTFRRDLYHRLKVVTIDLPRLADRREDIIPLSDHFRKQFARRHHKVVRGISGAASRRLFAFDWPGNVRQLRNAIESMVVIDTDETLDVDDLPMELEATSGSDLDPSPGNEALPLIGQPLSEIERWAIEQTLQLTGGNREETARILGIGARTLYRKIKEYGLQDR
jgi:two-component system response regulator HydG